MKPETRYARLLVERFRIGASNSIGQHPVWRDGALDIRPGESRNIVDDSGRTLFTIYGPADKDADHSGPESLWWVRSWTGIEKWPTATIDRILAEGIWELGQKFLPSFPSDRLLARRFRSQTPRHVGISTSGLDKHPYVAVEWIPGFDPRKGAGLTSIASRVRWEVIDELRSEGLAPLMWITREDKFSRVVLAILFCDGYAKLNWTSKKALSESTTQVLEEEHLPGIQHAEIIARALRTAADLPSTYGVRFSIRNPISLPFPAEGIRMEGKGLHPITHTDEALEWLASAPTSVFCEGSMLALDRQVAVRTRGTGAWAVDSRMKIVSGLLRLAGEDAPPKAPSRWAYWNPVRQEWITAPEDAEEDFFRRCIRSDRAIALSQRGKDTFSRISVDFDVYVLATGEKMMLTPDLLKEIIVPQGIRKLQELGIKPVFALSGHGFHADLFLVNEIVRDDAEMIVELLELVVASDAGFVAGMRLPDGNVLENFWRRTLIDGTEVGVVRDTDNLNGSVSLWTSYNERVGRRVMPVDIGEGGRRPEEDSLMNAAWLVERITARAPEFTSSLTDRSETWMMCRELDAVKRRPPSITCSTPHNNVIGAECLPLTTALSQCSTFEQISEALPALLRCAMRACLFDAGKAKTSLVEAFTDALGAGSNRDFLVQKLLTRVDRLLETFSSEKAEAEGRCEAARLLSGNNRHKILQHVLAKVGKKSRTRLGFVLTWAMNEAITNSEFTLGTKGLALVLGDRGTAGRPDHTGIARSIRTLWQEIGILVEHSPPVHHDPVSRSRNVCRKFMLNMGLIREIVEGPDSPDNDVVYLRTEEWIEAHVRRPGRPQAREDAQHR